MSSSPATFGRYQVVSQIGHGGMGALYLAWDPTLERKVAIKVLIVDNAELRERFSREARSAARLRHRHIVTMYDVGEYDGHPFMAMEYVEGQTLADVIRKREPLSTVRKLQLAGEIGDGLAYAHKAGVIHRDVKPANVMVDVNGAAKILDFGTARLVESAAMTQAGTPIGTLNYMSPEQLSGQKVDQRSDIFSFGALLYELFSYRQAFPGGIDTGVLYRVLHSEREPLGVVSPKIDRDIVRVVDRSLEPDTAKRYQELDSLLKDLDRIRVRLNAAITMGLMPGDDSKNADSTPTLALPPPALVIGQSVSPASRSQASRRPVDLEELARRRATQIQDYLKAAHEAFSAGDLDEGIAACEKVMMLDAEEPTAIALLDRARAELDERQAEECLAEAEREIHRGALTAALAKIEQAEALAPSSLKAAQLRKLANEALQERERARQRGEAIRQALARGRAHFDQGRFQDAASAADEALALDAGLSDAKSLKAQSLEAAEAEAREALARRAREAVREARRLFSANQHDSAISLLARFEAKDEHVSLALAQLRTEVARLAEQRRLEAERRARQERVDAELLAARRDIDEQEFGHAIDRLHALADAEGVSPEISGLIDLAVAGQAELERAAAIGREVAEHVARAAGLLARNDLTGASSRVDAALALDPNHAAALNLRVKIQEGLKIAASRREAEERRVRERSRAISAAIATAGAAESHEAAIAALDEALLIDPDHGEVRRLLAHHRELLGKEYAGHRQRAEAEKTRREQIQQNVDLARRALHREDLEAARLAVARIRDLDPRHIEAAELAKEIELAELRSREDPWNKETRLVELGSRSDPWSFEAEVPPLPASVPLVSSPNKIERKIPGRPVKTEPKTPGTSPAQERRLYTTLGIGAAALAVAALSYWAVGHRAPAVPAPGNQAAGESPSVPSPKASDTPPAAVPEPGPPTAPAARQRPNQDPAVEKRLETLRRFARRQYARGERQQALTAATTGLSLRPEDVEIKSFLNQALKDARSEVAAARSAALATISASRPSATYKDAERRSHEAERLAEAGPPIEAIRSYWIATGLFVKAAEAKSASTPTVATPRVAAPSVATPPASPPPAPDVRPAQVNEPPPVQRPQPPVVASPPPAVTPPTTPPVQATVPVVQLPPAQAPSPRSPSDEQLIRTVIATYAEAYSKLDVRAVQRVYPDAPAEALQRTFSQLKSQKIQVPMEQVQVAGTTATATLTWQTDVVGQVGGARSDSRKVVITLQKSGVAWIIVGRR